jgi:hypothetical protein
MVKLDLNRMLLVYILNTNIKRPLFPLRPQPKWADGGMVNIVGTRENWKISSSKSSTPPNLKGKKVYHRFDLIFIPHKSNFFLLNLIGPDKKKLKLWKLTKIEDSVDRWSASPFGSPIYVRRGGHWAKHMGLICASDDCFVLFFDRAWHGSPCIGCSRMVRVQTVVGRGTWCKSGRMM